LPYGSNGHIGVRSVVRVAARPTVGGAGDPYEEASVPETTENVTVLISTRAQSGRETRACEALATAIATSEKPGMLSSRQFIDAADGAAFVAVQEWTNVEAFNDHMSAVADGIDDATAMLAEPPTIRVLRALG
jgi:quinol monooxygenase YgiN